MPLSLETTKYCYQLYNTNVKLKEIASIQGCSISHIKRSFLYHGLKSKQTGNPPRFSYDQTLEMYKDYRGGMSFQKISEKYNTNNATVFRSFKKHNLNTRISSNESRVLNESCFDILTGESLYWLGFIMADGWVNCRNSIGLGVHSADIKHLEKFKNFIKGNQKISHHKNRDFCYIQFQSSYVAKVLNDYGVTKNKSLTAAPSKNLVNSFDFWRGMVDGDGSLCVTAKNRIVLSFAGSKNSVDSFKSFCVSNLGETGANVRTHGNIFIVNFTAEYAKKVASLLYKNSIVTQRLDRKYDSFIKMFL
jgi:hypothetical protein